MAQKKQFAQIDILGTNQTPMDAYIYMDEESGESFEFYEVELRDSKFYHKDEELNYTKLLEKFNDNKYFLYLKHLNLIFIPSIETDDALAFSVAWTRKEEAGDVEYPQPYISRVIINADEVVRSEQTGCQATDLMLDSYENYEDQYGEKMYPSAKAVKDLVEAGGGEEKPQTYILTTPAGSFSGQMMKATLPEAAKFELRDGIIVIFSSPIARDGTSNDAYLNINNTGDKKIVSDGLFYSAVRRYTLYGKYVLKYAASNNCWIICGKFTQSISGGPGRFTIKPETFGSKVNLTSTNLSYGSTSFYLGTVYDPIFAISIRTNKRFYHGSIYIAATDISYLYSGLEESYCIVTEKGNVYISCSNTGSYSLIGTLYFGQRIYSDRIVIDTSSIVLDEDETVVEYKFAITNQF